MKRVVVVFVASLSVLGFGGCSLIQRFVKPVPAVVAFGDEETPYVVAVDSKIMDSSRNAIVPAYRGATGFSSTSPLHGKLVTTGMYRTSDAADRVVAWYASHLSRDFKLRSARNAHGTTWETATTGGSRRTLSVARDGGTIIFYTKTVDR